MRWKIGKFLGTSILDLLYEMSMLEQVNFHKFAMQVKEEEFWIAIQIFLLVSNRVYFFWFLHFYYPLQYFRTKTQGCRSKTLAYYTLLVWVAWKIYKIQQMWLNERNIINALQLTLPISISKISTSILALQICIVNPHCWLFRSVHYVLVRPLQIQNTNRHFGWLDLH